MQSFLPGSSVKEPRADSNWTPLDLVPMTGAITVAEGWSTLIGQGCLITRLSSSSARPFETHSAATERCFLSAGPQEVTEGCLQTCMFCSCKGALKKYQDSSLQNLNLEFLLQNEKVYKDGRPEFPHGNI